MEGTCLDFVFKIVNLATVCRIQVGQAQHEAGRRDKVIEIVQ